MTNKNIRLAVVSPYNSECGISTYTESLYDNGYFRDLRMFFFGNYDIDDRTRLDQQNVVRDWELGEESFSDLIKDVNRLNINIVHIQFHSGYYFTPNAIDCLVDYCNKNSIKLFITLHSLHGPGFDYSKSITKLNLADRVFVQNKNDFNYLANKNTHVTLFPHPFYQSSNISAKNLKEKLRITDQFPIIITHGFLHKNKGIDRIIDAIALLKNEYPKILFIALCSLSKRNIEGSLLLKALKKQVESLNLQNNVLLIEDFLPQDVIDLIFKVGEINVLAYGEVGEGGSGVIRTCLTSGNPTIVTDIKAFEEFNAEVFKIKDNSPKNIVKAITTIIQEDLSSILVDAATKYVSGNTFSEKAKQLREYYESSVIG